MNFKKINCFIFLFMILLSCSADNKKIDIQFEKANDSKKIQKITVELAITPVEQERGFMERKVIPEGTGMIFAYKKDKKMHFWMKNTPHPLSIAFIDSSGIIREIYDMTPYSLETVSSEHSVRYALEVPRGMFARMDLGVGDKIVKESLFLIKRYVLGLNEKSE